MSQIFALLRLSGNSLVSHIFCIRFIVICLVGDAPVFSSSAVMQSGPGAFLLGILFIVQWIWLVVGMLGVASFVSRHGGVAFW